MNYRLIVLPRAEIDLVEQAEYLARDNVDTAGRFLEQSKATFSLLKSQPEMGARHECKSPLLNDLRVWPIQKFPNWLVFYQIRDTEVRILRILHGARDLGSLWE